MKPVTTQLGEFSESEVHVEDGYMWLHMSQPLNGNAERFLQAVASRGKNSLSITIINGRLLVETDLVDADAETIEKLVRGFLLRVKTHTETLDDLDIKLYTQVLDLREQHQREQDEVYHEARVRA